MKISVDRKQRKNTYLRREEVQPTREQLSMAFEAALLLFEQVGDLGDQIEVVKVSWFQPAMALDLDWEFRIVIDTPSSDDKFDIKVAIGAFNVRNGEGSEPNLSGDFQDVEGLTKILVEVVRREIGRKQEELQTLFHALGAELRSIPAAAA